MAPHVEDKSLEGGKLKGVLDIDRGHWSVPHDYHDNHVRETQVYRNDPGVDHTGHDLGGDPDLNEEDIHVPDLHHPTK